MKRKELAARVKLQQKRDEYKAQAAETKTKIVNIRQQLTKLRNHEQYLKRCIVALDTELGHIKAGQLSFNI